MLNVYAPQDDRKKQEFCWLKSTIKVWPKNFKASKGTDKDILLQSIADAETILEAWGGDQEVEADENSKFFHGIVNRKRRQLAINGIMKEGIKVLRRSESYNSLNAHQSSILEEPVSEVEIKKAIWDCGSDKSPGPDGFTFAFYKRYWCTLKNDIIPYVREFFDSGKILVGCNSSFITLIPKESNPLVVSDFRLISLIGAQYKIIVKILANRLSRVIATVISSEQTAFVSQRQILDGPLMVNEIIDWYKRKKAKLMILKIDFEKAFDSVSWDFLDQVLQFTGFGHTWRSWIRGCLSSAKASVLVNGSPTAEFDLQRGLRQGDPLSPFLFILVMEGLHVAIEDAINAGLFYGAKLHSLHVSHLFFTDDVLLLGEWSSVNISNFVNLLNCFYKVSGLKLNLHKSNLFGIGVDPSEVSVWACIVKSINNLNEKGIIPFSTLKRKVNDGTSTKFWRDSWICDTPLAIKYPRLFRLEINQECLVSDKWNGEWIWSWSRPITGGTIGSHLEELQNLVSNVHLGDAIDEWQWNVLNQKMFTVKHTRLHIDHLILPSEAPATRWCKSNPRKVNILIWRILRDRIPSRWNLSRKGVELSSLACPICSTHPETSHHLFWSCDLASNIWDLIFKWVDLFPNAVSSLTEMFSWLDNMNLRASRKLVLESIIEVSLWVIWKFRNQLVFDKKDWHRKDLFEHITSYSFLWFSSRNRKFHVSWNQWIQNPLLDNSL
ncbi:RNA-directed DNA polymerase, eukaryota [Tanacetum coccineum]